MFIPDPGLTFFPSRIPDPNCFIPDPHQRILTPKNGFSALGNMIRVVHPGSGSLIRVLTFTHPESRIPDPESQIPDPGVKKAADPGSGSATLVF
jgi:hypothetical protein